ncbi:MAG TPA: SMP-30/gluconolactonase/LRE family protein [Pirellulales bacterium]|jgi:sugar lactone lactonase YvrE|nr:SMP-30/gluconolactonase/LRE family protein [Pirellulales bacterium]
MTTDIVRACLFALLPLALFTSTTPAQDMVLSQILIDGEPWQQVAEGFKFTEGPAVDSDGNLFFTDIPNNRIYKHDVASNTTEVFVDSSGAANGLMFGPDGLLYACQNGNRRIVAYDASGKETVIAEDVDSNDLVVGRSLSIYLTDPKNHRVWYISPSRQKRVVDEGIERPNGIILWTDQQTLVVDDSAGKHLWAFRIEGDGSLTDKAPYYTCRLAPGQTASRADGMTIDSAGRLYVASLVGLQVFDPTGRLIGVILKPQTGPLSNVVFAGPKLDTLYVTAGDKVYRRKVQAAGLRYFDR